MITFRNVFKFILLNLIMEYDSLFDCIGGSGAPSYMKYEGSVKSVLNEILFDVESLNHDSRKFAQRVVLNAPRVVRGVLDYKIDNSLESGSVEVVRGATDFALSVYSDRNSVGKSVENFVDILEGTGNIDILDAKVSQGMDGTTWRASDDILSSRSARYLTSALRGRDTLFLLVGHGGVMPGLDVFLKYKEASGSNGSVAYPVRLSMDKKDDTEPRVNQCEFSYLQEIGRGREIVVFDEDIFSGTTMRRIGGFLESKLFQGKPFLMKTNKDPKGLLMSKRKISSVLEYRS